MKNIFKSFVVFAFIVYSDYVSAQGLVSMPEMNILYRNYDNILNVGFANGLENFNIQIEGAKWIKSGKSTYIIRPDENSRLVKMLVFNQEGEKSEYYYRCVNIPAPELFWGSSYGTNAAPEETNLFIRLRGAYFPFYNESFRPTEWTVSIGDASVTGTGNKLSKEVSNLIYAQKQKEVNVKITSAYISSSNSKGKVSASFKVINPYFIPEISNGRVFIIDKDSLNTSLFDENDPFSLISQIQSSHITNPIGMHMSTAERLIKSNQSLEHYYSDHNFVPMADSQGNDSVKVLPDSTFEVSYYSRHKRYYDKSNITRLVFYENTFIDPISKQKVTTISHVGLAKKYPNNNKYDIVMLIPFNQLTTCSDLRSIYKESNNPALHDLLFEINRTQTKESFQSQVNINNFIHFDLFWWEDLPFKDIRDNLSMKIFDSIYYYVEQNNLPLLDEYGDDLFQMTDDGIKQYVYPDPDTIIYKAYINPKNMGTFLKYELRMDDYRKQPQLVVTNVFYTYKTHDEDYAFCQIDLEYLDWSLLGKISEVPININELKWKYELSEGIEKAKTYSLLSKKDIKALAKEFNLDVLNGKAANLLGVSDQIKIK